MLRFLRNRSGNVAVTFAIMLLPILIAAGSAVDYSLLIREDTKLQGAIDAASISAASDMDSLSDSAIRQRVDDFLKSSLDNHEYLRIQNFDVAIDRSVREVMVTANAEMQTSFMGVAGISTLSYSPSATATSGGVGSRAEIVLVLDNTHSMLNDGKMDALKVSAGNFIDTLMANNTASAPDNVKVGIVPFSAYVNVGLHNRHESWLSAPATTSTTVCGPGPPVGGTQVCPPPGTTFINSEGVAVTPSCTLVGATPGPQVCNLAPSAWHGCVGSRNIPLNVEDGSYNSTPVPGLTLTNCPRALIELTTDKTLLLDEISQMTPEWQTYIPAGLSWGWRTLSSQAPFTGGLSNSDAAAQGVKKMMVLMTDGDNTLYPSGGNRHTSVAAHLSSQIGAFRKISNDLTELACQNIKDDDIEIFTVSFGTDIAEQSTFDILEDCASVPENYFHADDGSELTQAFEDILSRLSTTVVLVE